MENNNQLFKWCLEQVIAREYGELSEEQIAQLDSADFPWAYYENELAKIEAQEQEKVWIEA